MVVNKRKKFSRRHGNTTHGFGSMKKNRGAGHRGGRGNAGSGKRSDSKKPSNWKNTKYFGKHGFTSKSTTKVNAITIKHLDMNIHAFESSDAVKKEADAYTVDLGKLGYNKLLGTGKVRNKLNITVTQATQRAIEKIQAQGGTVVAESAKAE